MIKNIDLSSSQFFKYFFYLAFFGLLSIWYIPHTIAARYICAVIILIIVLTTPLDWRLFFRKSKFFIIFAAYLLIHLLFFSTNFNAGLVGFKSEWMHFILFTIAGAGSGLLFIKHEIKDILLYVAIALAAPLFIHALLLLIRGSSIGEIPWGYWGINEIHGDFAYPALQTSILVLTYILCQSSEKKKIIAFFILFLCFISPLIAQSRGGIIFTLISIVSTFLFVFFLQNRSRLLQKKKVLIFVFSLSVISLLLGIGVSADLGRWSGITTRAFVALEGNPILTHCNGISEIRDSFKKRGIFISPELNSAIEATKVGDGARVLAARTGFLLALKNPLGINGSKDAYQIAIRDYCGFNPEIPISHAHNAWIDTSLAIGIPGMLILLLVILNYGVQGFRMSSISDQINPYAIALCLSAFLWILRGLLDSTLRDQMLEMQAFIFALLYILALNYPKSASVDK